MGDYRTTGPRTADYKPRKAALPHNSRSAAGCLLLHCLNLAIDDLSSEPVYRHMHPVALFAFDVKLRQIGRYWTTRYGGRVTTALGDYIDQQVPGPCLICFPKCSRNRFAFRLWHVWA